MNDSSLRNDPLMKLVVVILNHPDLLEDVLTGFLEIGLSGATVLDSVGMGKILSNDVPIFAGLRQAFPGTSPTNRTILVVTEDHMVSDIVEVIEDICGSLDSAGAGMVLVLDVEKAFGVRPAPGSC